MAIELAQAGLNVLALERGEDAATVPNWAYPKVVTVRAVESHRCASRSPPTTRGSS